MVFELDSLAVTLDAIGEAFFHDRPLSRIRGEEAAQWIIGRQVRSGKQAGMFAPTGRDYEDSPRLFTGERLKTKLATRNILTAESATALILLGAPPADAGHALELANRWLSAQCFSDSCTVGECAHSTVGLMRYLASGQPEEWERRLQGHIKVLSRHRDSNGRWQRFPFYYTLLALAETELPSAVEEMRYAAPACERVLTRLSQTDRFSDRRQIVVHRVLARC
jgi:hypothetical protein